MAGVKSAQGQALDAARLLGAAEELREALGAPRPPNEREEQEQRVTRARSGAEPEEFEKAWAEGRSMTLDQALEFALSRPS